MDVAGTTESVLQPSGRSDALERFLSSDDATGSGYGVATYVNASLVSCRIYNLQTNELLGSLEEPGDYASLSGYDLKHTLVDIVDKIAMQAGISLSKLNIAVVSGPTTMESKVSGLEQDELLQSLEEELEELGRDVEFILAGSNSIAVGEAYFLPCVDVHVGGDVFCNLLVLDILGSEKPQLFINAGSRGDSGIVLVYGNKDALSVCVVPDGVSVKDAMRRLLEVCKAEYAHVECALVLGDAGVEDELPSELRGKACRVPDAAIEGTSTVLLSEDAEDELCRIVSACQIVRV